MVNIATGSRSAEQLENFAVWTREQRAQRLHLSAARKQGENIFFNKQMLLRAGSAHSTKPHSCIHYRKKTRPHLWRAAVLLCRWRKGAGLVVGGWWFRIIVPETAEERTEDASAPVFL